MADDKSTESRPTPAPIPVQRSEFEAGQMIGDFQLVSELGRGGVGVVWEAKQLSVGRPVALKILFHHATPEGRTLERFKREAEACGRLSHPGIVQVYAIGEANGVHYMAQELVPGGYTLGDSLEEFRGEKKLPSGYHRECAALFAKLADALHHAHERKVIHRDVKPSNILVGEKDAPKVADFGLAKVEGGLELSRTGEFMGTPFYMSPEQAAARRMGLDHRTDVFSLGASLYEAVTLVRAFGGETSQEVFHKILTVDPSDPRGIRSDVPRDLSIICLKALEKDPDRRYRTMEDFADDLRRFIANRSIQARPPGRLARATKWSRRHPVVSTSIAVAVGTALITLGGVGIWFRVKDLATPAMEQGTQLLGGKIPGVTASPEVQRLENEGRVMAARLSYGDGDYAAALAALEEVGEAYTAAHPGEVLPYLAMCQWQVGRQDEARATLERAQELLDGADESELDFLRRAEELIE